MEEIPTPWRSAAWPLALVYVCLVVYASLYPFAGWRNQGDLWWEFMTGPHARPWLWFDLLINISGYMPLGGLLTLAACRSWPPMRPWVLWMIVGLFCSALSMGMEFTQQFLPMRVPSRMDWLSNTLGGMAGVGLAWWLVRLGWIGVWDRFRSRWLVRGSRSSLALLLLWPFSLLFPLPVPLGLGQLVERIHRNVLQLLEDSILDSASDWLPPLDIWEAGSLSPFAEMLVVWLGLCVPLWLAGSVLRDVRSRALAILLLSVFASLCTTLSTAMSFGPSHALAWLGYPTMAGLLCAVVSGLLSMKLSCRIHLLLCLLSCLMGLFIINQAPANGYQLQNLQEWEQGQFMRFHGLSQWLGWLWPYALLVHLLKRLAQADAQSTHVPP